MKTGKLVAILGNAEISGRRARGLKAAPLGEKDVQAATVRNNTHEAFYRLIL
jgi:hypothetical protein